jgi:hypothetical protein
MSAAGLEIHPVDETGHLQPIGYQAASRFTLTTSFVGIFLLISP